MIVTRAPHRISFFGGGTDYPSYYLEHGGKVIGGAIDKYCYITCRELPPFFEHKHRIVYSRIENVSHLDEIVHPSVRETMRYMGVTTGLEIHHDGDIPARSGMGSSSAFTVCLLKTLYALQGRIISRENLYKEAIYIEQELIKENVGSQDQTFAACGGLNVIDFMQNGQIVAQPLVMAPERLKRFKGKLMLFFSGISRFASDIAKEQIDNTHKNLDSLSAMKGLVDDAYGILTSPQGDFDEFGRLLHETWQYKRGLSRQMSTSEIDCMYETAMKHGAIGGKLLGAGGGGFMLLYVPEERQAEVRRALGGYLFIPFDFDFSGAQIVVYKPSFQ
ncbi:GHMP family kinase ATP-binding protein [Trichlorobacter lovleyi]|jgi:Predicted kinase related to galactokinase and mevalonate kinase|uniref:GHMP kinase n=1 Tax=Trichlorobacter lovleyi (strain ATCC BAA-1151 / DSM 17278 / SZ) TaxID=398767 RepID=B3E4V4_TRIL1|nr:kinase [Trichlorobacter lovleyi]ACD94519.1 GHMP kinase [Trichlorobacter lovleyi SZ]